MIIKITSENQSNAPFHEIPAESYIQLEQDYRIKKKSPFLNILMK